MTDCYTAALRILNYRFNSEHELRRKLAAKKFDGEVIDAAIARLRDEKWLDDARFAEAFVRTRMRKRIGRLRIRRELGEAGVTDEVINAALAANADRDDERASLQELCAKRLRLVARRRGEEYAASREGRQKVAAYLVSQGFELGEVLEVLRAQR